MHVPSPAIIRLRYAYGHGRRDAVRHRAHEIRRQDPHSSEAGEASLYLGALAADAGNYPDAISLLSSGLDALEVADRDLLAGDVDAFSLLRVALGIRVGHYGWVSTLIQPLVEPHRQLDTRLQATRAHASLATIRGDYESAHHLLNTASGIAQRMTSRFRVTLVDGDRAIVLATQGRLSEAVSAADRAVGLLLRPAVGDMQRWSNLEAASVALTVSRACATTGDLLTAQRFLTPAALGAQRAADPFIDAHFALASAVFHSSEGVTDEAEAGFLDARRDFEALGCEPGLALTLLEQGRAAGWRGLDHTARPLLGRALTEFRRLGQPRECAEIASLLGVRQQGAPAIEGP